jgi:hypothetical protein
MPAASINAHDRRPVTFASALSYIDVVLVLIVAVPALALGAPALGYAVGAGAWILQRVASARVEHQISEIGDLRRRLGFGVATSMTRVWLLAIAIMVVGVASSRGDGLTAALVIFGAFSVNFGRGAFAHMAEKRARER